MTEWSDGQGTDRPKNNTTVWVVGGLVAVCLCVALAGAFGVILLSTAGLAFLGASVPVPSTPVMNSTSIPLHAPTSSIQKPAPAVGLAGETIDVPDQGRQHVPEGTTIVYNSNPPTSGPHYVTPLPAGFYTDSVPDGNIVHSLEHGYIVIWYDCTTLPNSECQALQDDIQGLIKASSQKKLIGIPRSGMDHPITLTSWTKLAYLDEFDADFIDDFIRTNILHAPEPNAP